MTSSTTSPDHLSNELRARTADLHTEAEHRPLQQQMVHGRISRPHYERWLGQMRLIHQTLADALSRVTPANTTLSRLADFAMDKPALLRADEEALGVDEAAVAATPATRALIDTIERAASENPVALAGVLYVLEGSTNGNRIIAGRLKSALGLEGGGVSYLDPYGRGQRPRWTEFKRLLDEAVLSRADANAAVDAAQQTFVAIGRMGDEILAARP